VSGHAETCIDTVSTGANEVLKMVLKQAETF